MFASLDTPFMTKQCKSCKEQMDQTATKCPKCQSYQQWYRSPQMISLFITLPLLAFMIWNISTISNVPTPDTFSDYKDKFSVNVVDDTSSADGEDKMLTVRLENHTNTTWRRPTFQVESLDGDGKVLSVEHVHASNMVVAPNSSTLDTFFLRIIPSKPVEQRRVTLTDIDSNRY